MQKVILELKLMGFVAPRPDAITRQESVTAALRAETQQLETRVAALLDTHERAIVDMQQSSGDAISELRARLANVEAELAPIQARSALLETLCQRIMTHVEQVQQNIEAIDERVNGVKDGADVLSQGACTAGLRRRANARIRADAQIATDCNRPAGRQPEADRRRGRRSGRSHGAAPHHRL
jgi:DNA repair exonuclease SbcCD ATPase subunit